MLFPFVNLIHGLVLSLIALRLVQLLNLFLSSFSLLLLLILLAPLGICSLICEYLE